MTLILCKGISSCEKSLGKRYLFLFTIFLNNYYGNGSVTSSLQTEGKVFEKSYDNNADNQNATFMDIEGRGGTYCFHLCLKDINCKTTKEVGANNSTKSKCRMFKHQNADPNTNSTKIPTSSTIHPTTHTVLHPCTTNEGITQVQPTPTLTLALPSSSSSSSSSSSTTTTTTTTAIITPTSSTKSVQSLQTTFSVLTSPTTEVLHTAPTQPPTTSTQPTTAFNPTFIDCKDAQSTHPTSQIISLSLANGIQCDIYCDMDTDGGGWTLIQRRFDGSVDFQRDWIEYKNGFGVASGEYWLGLEKINKITTANAYSLRVDMWDGSDHKFAKYTSFYLEDESTNYKLKISGYSGDTGDAIMIKSADQSFSTQDVDNDNQAGRSCAAARGAFWHGDCARSSPNGQYVVGDTSPDIIAVYWGTFKGNKYGLSKFEMKIRRI